MPEWCHAGRQAFLGGRWTKPCREPDNGREHLITAPGLTEPVKLCDTHFRDCLALDLVKDIDIGEAMFNELRGI